MTDHGRATHARRRATRKPPGRGRKGTQNADCLAHTQRHVALLSSRTRFSYLLLFQISAWFGSLTAGYGVSVAVLPLQTAGRPVPALQLEPLGTGCVRNACLREHCFAKNQSFPGFSVTVFPCGRCHMALKDNRTGWAAGLVRATGNCV